MFERGLNRIEVFENIRVIEFQIVDDGNFGQIMHEFAALVEKSGVVFVAFNDEPFTICKSRALAEVVRYSPDEITGIQAIVLEDPRQQRSGRGFAVSSTDDE